MLDIQRTLGNKSVLHSLAGLHRKQFDEWHQHFAAELLHRKMNPTVKRQRAIDAGRRHTLKIPEGMLYFHFVLPENLSDDGTRRILLRCRQKPPLHMGSGVGADLGSVFGKSHNLPNGKSRRSESSLICFPKFRRWPLTELNVHEIGQKTRNNNGNTVLGRRSGTP